MLCLGKTTRQPLWVILCRLLEKGRNEIEEIVEEMKERDREERGMKGKKQNENIPLYLYLLQEKQVLPNCKPVSVRRHGDVRYTSSPLFSVKK